MEMTIAKGEEEEDGVERVLHHQTLEITHTAIDGQPTNKVRGCRCEFSKDGSDDVERRASMQKLVLAVSLCVVFMVVEVVGGIKANSLAILADAGHLLSDVAAFAISLFSLWAAGWEVTPTQSFGFYRVEIIGAMLSIQLIWLITGILVFRAIHSLLHHTREVQGSLMFAVSAFGLIVNIIMAVVLGHDHHGHSHGAGAHSNHDIIAHSHHDIAIKTIDHHHHHHHEEAEEEIDENKPLWKEEEEEEEKERNINVQGAYLHVLGDSIQSMGVMIGGGIIWYKPEWKIIDLICTLVFSVIVLGTTVGMLRRIIEVLMESTPREIDATRLEKGVCEMDGVVAVHDLHIWAITVGKVLLACHVTIDAEADADEVLDSVVEYISMEYRINHVTIQIERDYHTNRERSSCGVKVEECDVL